MLPNGKNCFSATVGITGMVGAIGTITPGSGYINGSYGGVSLTGGTGSGTTANITVSGAIVTAVTILNPGTKYTTGDVLSATAASLGGSGSGFSVPVTATAINGSLAAGTVNMFVPATTTPKSTWQDAGQVTLNSAPIVLDANGCAVIYGTGTYRQQLFDSLGNLVWDQLTTDTSAGGSVFWAGVAGGVGNVITVVDAGFNGTDGSVIQFIALASNTGPATLNPSSFGAVPILKTSGSGPIALAAGDIVAGNVVNVVYVAATGSFQLLNTLPASITALGLPRPQGYLTLSSGVAVITGDVTNASTVYYTPFAGNQIPIYNGATFVTFSFAELTLTLTGSHLANTIYDLCVYSNNGAPVLVSGNAWSNSAAGAGARGTGAGTPQLQRVNGFWVNAVSFTASNAAVIPVNQCTYVGSIYTDNTAGQVSAHRTYGQNRKFGVWNAYNRQPIYLKAGDGTANWTGAAPAGHAGLTRAANDTPTTFASGVCNVGSGTTCNGLVVFSGLAEEVYDLAEVQTADEAAAGGNSFAIGIGYNSATAFSGKKGQYNSAGVAIAADMSARFVAPPALGINVIIALELLSNNANTIVLGTETNMLLSAWWRG